MLNWEWGVRLGRNALPVFVDFGPKGELCVRWFVSEDLFLSHPEEQVKAEDGGLRRDCAL